MKLRDSSESFTRNFQNDHFLKMCKREVMSTNQNEEVLITLAQWLQISWASCLHWNFLLLRKVKMQVTSGLLVSINGT